MKRRSKWNWNSLIDTVFKWAILSLFILFFLNWNRTRVLWYRRRPLCQLFHNHCPIYSQTVLIPPDCVQLRKQTKSKVLGHLLALSLLWDRRSLNGTFDGKSSHCISTEMHVETFIHIFMLLLLLLRLRHSCSLRPLLMNDLALFVPSFGYNCINSLSPPPHPPQTSRAKKV